jgi:hypothetical protein
LAAPAYDDKFQATLCNRHVMLYKLQNDKSYHDYDQNYHHFSLKSFDMSCPVSSMQAYVTDSRSKTDTTDSSRSARMVSNKWIILNDSNKAVMEGLDDQANQ